jgi:hypothetical protein
MRIEFTERYVSTEDREMYEDNMGMPVPESKYKYRRIYPHLNTIDDPMEIPGDREHTDILFNDGYVLVVKGGYDKICQAIEDRERQDTEGEGYEKGEKSSEDVENTV